MRHVPSLFIVSLVLLIGAMPARAQDAVHAQHHAMRRTVRVSGEGVARAAPDQAVVHFGVVTVADDPEAAREQNAEAASSAMNAVRELGIPEENIQLQTLRLQPQYDYDDGRRELIGYEAVREVVVEVDDLEQVPVLVAQIVEQGANRIERVQYELEDRDAARDEALREALREAREKAVLMVETLDGELGQVLRISEERYEAPRPVLYMEARAVAQTSDAAPAPDAFAPGEIEVRATVQVVFELE